MKLEKKINFGKIDWIRKGIRSHPAFISMVLDDYPKMPKLSIIGEIWHPSMKDIVNGGQCLDTIKEYIDNDLFNKIYRLWKLYHLNDMRGGTPRQMKIVNKYLENNPYDYEQACRYLESEGLLYDTNIEGLICNGGFPVEVKSGERGYKYGERWIYSPIPKEDLDLIIDILK